MSLAGYFRWQETKYQQKARMEKAEWQRRIQNPTSLAGKYPSPADSARNLFDYYSYRADQMGKNASHYENLVAGAR